jgi:hypothetical protein
MIKLSVFCHNAAIVGLQGHGGVRGEARFPPFKEKFIYNIKIFLHYIIFRKNVILSHRN